MEALLAGLEATPVAAGLRVSRWGYAAVSAGHVLGIALLVGAIVPLDLRLLGAWRSVPHPVLARVLVPAAAAGLALAVGTGLLLFSVRAAGYAALPVLQAKLVLVAAGAGAAIAVHARHGLELRQAPGGRLAGHALLSLCCWLGALACGRLIAFAGD